MSKKGNIARVVACALLVVMMALSLTACFGDGDVIPGGGDGAKKPIALIAFSLGDTKYDYDFDGSGSSDPDGTIVAWEWDFGDGFTGVGETTSHRYAVIGEYDVTLRVIDNDGNSSETTILIEIVGCSPQASFIASPSSIDVTGMDKIKVLVAFDGRKSSDCDGEDDICWAVWDFGDGTTPVGGIWTRSADDADGVSQTFSVMREVTHTYRKIPGHEYWPGQTEPQTLHYTVTLTLTDCSGRTDVATRDIVFYDDVPMP